MTIYGYKILNDIKTKESLNKCFLLKTSKPFVGFYYTLKLNNNQYREVSITSDNTFENIIQNQIINFIVKGVITFSFKIASKEISYILHEEGTSTLRDYWLTHTFLPIILTLENIYYILHAGAVEVENTPVLFVADSFGGKSTLTDFFIKKGHTMLSDDKVATYEKDGKIYAVPSYPYHRPYRKVEDLGIFVENFAKEEKAINTIFHLVKTEPNSDIAISKIKGIEKFKVLRYATDIDLPINQKTKFEKITNIANRTDIYNITIPWDINRLEEVYHAIIEFIKQKEN